jgi:carbonic anhydrase/acetyltransferase-like protein (isoleucine patch superfamily)
MAGAAGGGPARGPRVDPTAFVHPLAFVCGHVTLGARASVWPFAAVRGDNERIVVGAECNVQDGAVLHADPGVPCVLGARASVGHRAVVHGARVGDGALVGMGALVLNGAHVGAGALVAAGAVVREGFVVPPGVLVAGVPARVLRELTADEAARLARTADAYVRLQARHRAGEFPWIGVPGPAAGS